MKPFKRS